MINILYLSPWNLGGATSYVVNLVKTFQLAGVPHRVIRFGKRTEANWRRLGEYGVRYKNVAAREARQAKGRWLLASAPTDAEEAALAVELVETSKGAYVFHDPNEFTLYPHWKLAGKDTRTVVIRETGLDSVPHGTFIPHPYVPFAAQSDHSQLRTKFAVSIARVSAVKNSQWILEANTRLPDELKVELRGSVNRFWWNFSIKNKHPEYVYPSNAGFVRKHGEAVRACLGYRYMVDLTIFKNDGGGTQYSLLEAIDAGAVPVMTKDWCSYPGIAKKLGFQVGDAAELEQFLLQASKSSAVAKETDRLREENYKYMLRVHDPKKIAAKYVALLES